MTSTMAGTPMIQARKYLPMIVLLSSAIDHGFRMPEAGAGVRTLVHGVRGHRPAARRRRRAAPSMPSPPSTSATLAGSGTAATLTFVYVPSKR